jgi:hypothetical protein
MQFTSTKKPPPGVVYDSDFGNKIDSVLALGLLHGLDGKNFCRIASISVNTSNLRAAQFADAVEKYYTGVLTGNSAIFFQAAAIGLAVNGKPAQETPMFVDLLARKNDAGEPVYPSRIRSLKDTAIVEALIRNALTAQYDQNAIVVLSGPASDLVRVLDLPGAKEVVTAKVKLLSVAGGSFPAGPADPMLCSDVAAVRRLLAEWPSPIVFAGREVGNALRFRGAGIEKDFAYAPTQPVAAAYRVAGTMPYDAPAASLAAMLYAVRPDEGFFNLSPSGTVRINDNGSTEFFPSASGRHRFLIVDPAQSERVLKTYSELVSAPPVRRVRRPLADAEQADEKKGDEKKDETTKEVPVKKP